MKARVLLPKVFNFPFTYNSNIKIKVGDLVEVPFGSNKELGVIWKNNFAEPKNIKMKSDSEQIKQIRNTYCFFNPCSITKIFCAPKAKIKLNPVKKPNNAYSIRIN